MNKLLLIWSWKNYIWIYFTFNFIGFGYCNCPFMEKLLEKSKILYETENKLKHELYDDNFMVAFGQPGASFWANFVLNSYQKELIQNASIGLMTGQLYSQSVLRSSNGIQFTKSEKLAKIKSQSKCIPEEYRCKILNKTCQPNDPYQTIDGTCNNLILPTLGSSFSPYNRRIDAVYNDDLYAVRRSWLTSNSLISPRIIGNQIYNKSAYTNSPSRNASINGLFFGQYIAHDSTVHLPYHIGNEELMRCCSADYGTRLPHNLMSVGCLPIDLPRNDEYFSKYNMKCMEFVRTAPLLPKECELGSIKPGNTATGILDKSILYGSSKSDSDGLRTMINGTLKTNKYGNIEEIPNCPFNDWRCYRTGSPTGVLNIMFTAVIMVNLHFHNYLAQILAVINPNWNDEKLFQEARRIFIAVNYHFIYDEWIPLFIGEEFAQQYSGHCKKTWPYCDFYNSSMDGSTMTEFGHGAMRMFHQLVPAEVNFYNDTGEIYKTLPLRDVILQPGILNKDFSGALRGMLYDHINVFNTYSFQIRNEVFSNYQKNGIGLDLSSIDIQRGRDMGVAPYYQYVEICSSVGVTKWSDLEQNIISENIEKAKQIYDSVFDLDLITGIFLEKKHNYMGPVARCIISEQFNRFRIGDRYFYTNKNRPHAFTKEQLNEINNYSYAKMICSNGNLNKVPTNALEIPSDSNPMINCNSLSQINLNLWKE